MAYRADRILKLEDGVLTPLGEEEVVPHNDRNNHRPSHTEFRRSPYKLRETVRMDQVRHYKQRQRSDQADR